MRFIPIILFLLPLTSTPVVGQDVEGSKNG